MKALSWRALFAPRQTATSSPRAPARPLIRRVENQPRLGLREFDWNADAEIIGEWQRETYALNFPDFAFSNEFASAFHHDLRRAALDENNGLFVLSELDSNRGEILCGFVWIVLCHNNWTGERYGYINNLYVAPARRGCGLSDELLLYAESWFRERHVTRLRLTVTSTNVAAFKLYERMGYETQRFEMEKEL